jgi:hypothetical protein
MTRTRIAAATILAAALAGSLAGCGGGPSESACKAAMTRDYHYALAHPGAPPAARPAACKGVPDATVRKFAAEIMAGG